MQYMQNYIRKDEGELFTHTGACLELSLQIKGGQSKCTTCKTTWIKDESGEIWADTILNYSAM